MRGCMRGRMHAYVHAAFAACGDLILAAAGEASDVRVVMPISGELRYDAFCDGIDPETGQPYGCHYGVWDEVSAVNSSYQP